MASNPSVAWSGVENRDLILPAFTADHDNAMNHVPAFLVNSGVNATFNKVGKLLFHHRIENYLETIIMRE
jgi:hypothetical protein